MAKIICQHALVTSKTNSKNNDVQFEAMKCHTLPSELVDKPLLALDVVASNGSALAKTYYLSQALELARVYNKMDDEIHKVYAKNILTKAEEFGFEAAIKGSVHANFIMSRVYTEGLFGNINLVKAATFFAPLEKHFKSGEIDAVLGSVYSKLTSNEMKKAREVAFGCITKENHNLSNPFL